MSEYNTGKHDITHGSSRGLLLVSGAFSSWQCARFPFFTSSFPVSSGLEFYLVWRYYDHGKDETSVLLSVKYITSDYMKVSTESLLVYELGQRYMHHCVCRLTNANIHVLTMIVQALCSLLYLMITGDVVLMSYLRG